MKQPPKNWIYETNHPLVITAAEGTAINLEEAIRRYAEKGRIKLDFSPKLPQRGHDLWVGNIYEPEDVCTLQAGQDNDGKKKPYTTIVCTGTETKSMDTALEFAGVSEFEPTGPSRRFIQSLLDQSPLRTLYDASLKNLGTREAALVLFAASLKLQQEHYKNGSYFLSNPFFTTC